MMSTEEVTNGDSLIEWAEKLAESLLAPLGNRWLHVQGVADRAKWASNALEEKDRPYLIAAAYLHDIGYAPELKKTGFHPIDGANYLRSENQERLASLVAYHSEAQFEAKLRSLTSELNKFLKEVSSAADTLTYCDMTIGPAGQKISFRERIESILERYGETDIVSRAIKEAKPFLSIAVEKTQRLLYQQGLKDCNEIF